MDIAFLLVKFPEDSMMDRLSYWTEIGFAVLIASATVLTAWCAYQSARWSGVQALRFSEANAVRSESLRQSDIGDQRVAIDVGLWVQYIIALSEENQKLADFLYERFPPELKAANRIWLETNPLSNPDSPDSPFHMLEYSLPAHEEAQRLAALADQKTEEAKQANQRSDNYVLLTVIFASVLFLGGIGSKFVSVRLRTYALAASIIVLFASLVVISTYPVH